MLTVLASCSWVPGLSDDEPELAKGTVGHVQGFYGGVSADEPQAAIVGRDVLAAGGTAADAAVAVYFMLSVTYPNAASLGGGGQCLVRQSKRKPKSKQKIETIETIDFLGQASTGNKGVRVNVPGNPRGFFALHAKYGELRWGELVRPAENAARFGTEVSRATYRGMVNGGAKLNATPAAKALFAKPGGAAVGEGDFLKQAGLAATLGRIRARGAGVLYSGNFARQFAASAQESGAAITYQDLNAVAPIWRGVIEVPFVERTYFYFPLPRTQAGTMAAKAIALAIDDDRYAEAEEGERVHLIAEAVQRAIADGGSGFTSTKLEDGTSRVRLPEDYVEGLSRSYHDDRVVRLSIPQQVQLSVDDREGQTSFTVVDRKGGVVTCALTMNGPFGSGRVVPGTGVFLAAPPRSLAERDLSLGGFVLTGKFTQRLFMAGSASGGAGAQAAMLQVALRTGAVRQESLEKSMRLGRVFRNPSTGITEVEASTAAPVLNALRGRGHDLRKVNRVGRAHIMYCETGIPVEKPACTMQADPRSLGYAAFPG